MKDKDESCKDVGWSNWGYFLDEYCIFFEESPHAVKWTAMAKNKPVQKESGLYNLVDCKLRIDPDAERERASNTQ